MTHPAWALQKALFALLSSDTELTNLLGASRIYDGPPRRAVLPFIAFDPVETTDIGGDDAELIEHQVSLSIWARGSGKREVLEIAERVRDLAHDAALTLDQNRLVNLRLEREEVSQLDDRRTWRGDLSFRAVTEPL